MLALHTSNLAPGLTMQQANPHTPHSAPANKPLITGTPPQLIPMATVPQSQFFIRGGYTLLPPLTPLTNVNVDGSSFNGLTPLNPLGGLSRPITAIPYYSPTDVYQRGPSTTINDNTSTPGLRNHGNAILSAAPPRQSTTNPDPTSSPPSLSSLPPALLSTPLTLTPPQRERRPSGNSPTTASPSSLLKTSLPNSLDLASPVRTRCSNASPTRNLSLSTTPDHTPQTATPRLLSATSPLDSRDTDHSPLSVKREPTTAVDKSFACPNRPKSADAAVDDASVFPSGVNPYPINALIDAPTSLGRGSRTSSLSSSISSFRFGGSLNKLWASQLSLSNRVNMKSTGSLNTDAATMPSLGNQYFALGGSLPELSLTSLTRLLPNSTANDASNTSQHSLFTLVHHPTPLYVYSSQQHLTTPFINPNGSITFGSFLSPGSSLCNPVKTNSPSNQEKRNSSPGGENTNTDCAMSDVKEEDSDRVMDRGSLSLAATSSSSRASSSATSSADVKMATYSPITAHMIHPATHATLNRAVPVMTIPTFGTTLTTNLSNLPPAPQTPSPPHPSIVPHVSPYSPLITTSTSSTGTSAHPSHIIATPSSLDISSEATPSSHLSPSMPSTVIGHSPLSPMHSSSTIDSKKGVLVLPPSDLYLRGPSINGMHAHAKLEATDPELLTPTSEDQLISRGSKREKDKPYKCDHPGCERSFSFPAHLRSHIQQIHISYRPCKCEFPGCGKRFYTPQHLNVHRRVHTGERPFVCPYTDCSKAFTTAGNLKNHIRTHTGERPYACKFEGCTKRFAEMSSLKKHELTHTGEKPYKCRVCGKAFSQAGSRNTHERKHSRTDSEEFDEGKVGRRYRIKRVPPAPSCNSNQN